VPDRAPAGSVAFAAGSGLALATMTTVVFYAHYESPENASNLEFFAEVGMEADDQTTFVIVINGGRCSIPLPDRERCIVLRRDNIGFDFGAHNHGIRFLARTRGCPADQLPFDHFVFLNSTVAGPFLPAYYPRDWHWTTVLTSRLNERVKLVGPSIVCLPAWDAGGYGPRVEGYCFATDRTGLGVLWRDGNVFRDHPDPWSNIVHGEYGMSRAILGAGYSLDCLLYRYQGIDWADPANWDQNDHAHPSRQGTYGGISIHPFEVVFHKWFWQHHPTRLVAHDEVAKYREWKLGQVRAARVAHPPVD
jgi:hypothetical protein